MNRLKFRRAVVAPLLVAFAALIAFSGFVPLGQSSERDIAYAASPAHGGAHAVADTRPGHAPVSTLAGPPPPTPSFDCNWWGGTVQPWTTNYVRTSANGWCTNSVAINWNSTLTLTTQGTPHSETSNQTVDDFGQGTLNYGTVPVGSSVGWGWNATMTTPTGSIWTGTPQDPTHCAIQTNPQIIICIYTGTYVPFPVAGTSTPTRTPFPTLTPLPADCATNGWLEAVGSLTKKIPVTASLFTTEFFYATQLGQFNNIHFQKIERTYSWSNVTTGGFGAIVTPVQAPILVPVTGPDDQHVTLLSQIGGVGNGIINVAFKALAYYTGGASGTCMIYYNNSITNT